MHRQIKAIYEQGQFRPIDPDEVQLNNGDTVWLQVYTPPRTRPVFIGFSQSSI